MALPPLAFSFPDLRALPNFLHNPNGHTPLTLPASARGTPPPNAVPNPSPGDSVELSGAPAPRTEGRLAVDGSGVYRLVQASSFSLSAESLRVQLFSGASGGGSAGRGALGALDAALAPAAAGGGGLMDRLRGALEKLGLSEESARDLLLIAGVLEKLDPEAFGRFVESLEKFANALSDAQAGASAPVPSSAAPTSASAAGQPSAGGQSVQLNYVSIQISFTEVSVQASAGEGGANAEVSARQFEVRFERLEVSIGQQQPQGDPVVLDLDGDGAELRPTSDGVRFDIAGSGAPVQTAFVAPDDALLFYDANANGLLDGGAELVGNRVPGLDGMAELSAMDADGDGQVTAADPAWSRLRLYQDVSGDGAAGAAGVRTLEALGITGLSALWSRGEAQEGEGLRRVGAASFTRADGSQGLMLDYYFGYRPEDAQTA